ARRCGPRGVAAVLRRAGGRAAAGLGSVLSGAVECQRVRLPGVNAEDSARGNTMQTAERTREPEQPRTARGQKAVSTVVVDDESVHIPEWVVDLESFRRWVHSDEVPEKLRVCFLDGEV